MRSAKSLLRRLRAGLLRFLPQRQRRRTERFRRGRKDYGKLQRADFVVVSSGKSGRTWLRVLISRFFQARLGLPDGIFFTHDNNLKHFTGNRDSKADYYDKKVILLVRDPCDTAVSHFFHWKFRRRQAEKVLNPYTIENGEISIFDFVMTQGPGLRGITRFLNAWARELPKFEQLLVVRYEDLRAEPEPTLGQILRFMGQEPTDSELEDAVAFASFENMRRMEAQEAFASSGNRLKPADKEDPRTYKVRRGKVSGYRDYLTEDQVVRVESFVRRRLLPGFGYLEDADTTRSEEIRSGPAPRRPSPRVQTGEKARKIPR
jgi:hypothetical protein